MNRLTIRIDNGLDEIYFSVPDDTEGAYCLNDLVKYGYEELWQEIAHRLTAYEDTGLAPEEIQGAYDACVEWQDNYHAMQEENTQLQARLRELEAQAGVMREVLKDAVIESDEWWCPTCKRTCSGTEVTSQGYHEDCGTYLEDINTPEWLEKARKALSSGSGAALLEELEQWKKSDASKEQTLTEYYNRAKEAERELSLTKRALELACEQIAEYALPCGTDDMKRKLIAGRIGIFLSKAKKAGAADE